MKGVGEPCAGEPHARLYVPRTVMLNADLPGAISLAAQGLTDQTFHIILLSIDASWIRYGI